MTSEYIRHTEIPEEDWEKMTREGEKDDPNVTKAKGGFENGSVMGSVQISEVVPHVYT